MTYFRQLVSADGLGFSYLLADLDKRKAVLIDPVLDRLPLYLSLLEDIKVRLVHVLLTHVHGGNLLAGDRLKAGTGAKLGLGAYAEVKGADGALQDDSLVDFGDEVLMVRFTPGHTQGCTSYIWRDRVFTGDALLIDDCGECDENGADPGMLYDSLSQRLLVLPDETLVYPARTCDGRRVTCIGEQRLRNPRIAGVSRDEFIAAQARRGPRVPLLNLI